jgi:uncharacterized protein
MNEKHILKITDELKLNIRQVAATAVLLDEGSTVPFIARYRKERTGQLDEVQIAQIRDRLVQLVDLDARRVSILKSLEERSLLTDELQASVGKADSMATLEDLYLPFRPKRRTRASMAKEKGLEPLAKMLFDQAKPLDPEKEAGAFVDSEKKVADVAEALAGARDIMAEWISEDAEARKSLRGFFEKESLLESKVGTGAEEKGAKFRDYFDWKEPVSQAPSHRVLAMFRGENEEFLRLKIQPQREPVLGLLLSRFVKGAGPVSLQVQMAVIDAYDRLLAFSMEAETRISLKDRAGQEAIRVFASNLRELLMAPPLGQKTVLALDPGFRTGCKIVCLDPQGKLLFNVTLHLTSSKREAEESAAVIKKMVDHFKVDAIAIGNGTASRETETFVKAIPFTRPVLIVMVNESGASIYSASEVARDEFPDQDVTVRGSVSIGRRLMDPLAELVKIDPKSIGVGQYQHDVNPGQLKQSLDDVVMSCVNNVGVEVNTASKQLLTYVSGLNATLALNIVQLRNEKGPFTSRSQLKKVPRLGPKAFEQAAGFLRIRSGDNPLDASAVHPERYALVEQMARDLKCSVEDLMKSDELRKKIDLKKYVTEEVGMPTLTDILNELAKPGRDPREKFEAFSFSEDAHELKDLKPGMKLPGIVTNVTKFGAFVDIGVHQDGLVHISELADQYVSDPADVVKVQQKVQVTVIEVDAERKRVALSMKTNPGQGRAAQGGRKEPGPRDARGGGGGPARPARADFNSNPFGTIFAPEARK